MCRKVRVIYPKCGHKITEAMEYCIPSFSERVKILNERGECPNDVLSISIDTEHTCQRCEDWLDYVRSRNGEPIPEPVIVSPPSPATE